MTWYADDNPIPSQCGGRLIHKFNQYSGDSSLEELKAFYKGHMLVATFNHTQRAAYEACCQTFTWLGQSTPIRNPNSGNYIFTAVFKA